MFKIFKKNANVTYAIVDRGGYYVIKRYYANGNVKSDRMGSVRANSTLRTAINGRAFG